jgi:DNA polymerase III subunit beta
MKFITDKSEFIQGIQEVQRVTYGKAGITTLQWILIEAQKDHLVLTGGDKNLCIETRVSAEVLEEGKIVVESKLLGDIIRKLPNALLEISTIDANQIKIVCEKNVVTLGYQDKENFPTLPSIKEDLIVSMPQAVLKKMIKSTIIATDQNGLRPIFSGVLFDLGKDKLNMVALDNSRAAICRNINDSTSTISVVIPGRTLSEVAKIIEWEDKDVYISFTSNHILFTIGKTKVISTLLEGVFGKYETFIPKEYTLEIIINKDNLIGHLERAAVIGREGSFCAVVFDIGDNILTITSNSQFGNIRGEIEILSQGTPMLIKLNAKYLLEALNTLTEDEVIIKFTTNQSVFVVTNRSNTDTMHIIAPVRM